MAVGLVGGVLWFGAPTVSVCVCISVLCGGFQCGVAFVGSLVVCC